MNSLFILPLVFKLLGFKPILGLQIFFVIILSYFHIFFSFRYKNAESAFSFSFSPISSNLFRFHAKFWPFMPGKLFRCIFSLLNCFLRLILWVFRSFYRFFFFRCLCLKSEFNYWVLLLFKFSVANSWYGDRMLKLVMNPFDF